MEKHMPDVVLLNVGVRFLNPVNVGEIIRITFLFLQILSPTSISMRFHHLCYHHPLDPHS